MDGYALLRLDVGHTELKVCLRWDGQSSSGRLDSLAAGRTGGAWREYDRST
jgi:hypothetical protein